MIMVSAPIECATNQHREVGMGFSVARRALCGSVAALGALLAGCSAYQGVQVRDDDSPALALRATVRPQAWHGQRSEGGIEFGYERYRGTSTQAIAAGTFVDVGGQSISGPDSLRNQATVQQLHVAYSHRFHFGPNFQLEPMGGLADVNLALKVKPTTAAVQPSDESRRTALIWGVTPRWRFNDKVAIEARILGLAGALVDGNSVDASLLLSPTPNVTLRVGYSDRSRYAYLPNSLSRLDIHVRGPSASLAFDF